MINTDCLVTHMNIGVPENEPRFAGLQPSSHRRSDLESKSSEFMQIQGKSTRCKALAGMTILGDVKETRMHTHSMLG